MAATLNKLTKGSKLVFEISFEILKGSAPTDLYLLDNLVDGLSYTTDTPPDPDDEAKVFFYDTSNNPTAITGVTTDYDEPTREIKVLLDTLLNSVDFKNTIAVQDTTVVIQIPVTITDISKLPADIDTETNFKYFTNNYQLIVDNDTANPLSLPEPSKFYWDSYKFTIYGGSDTVDRTNGIPVDLYGFFRSIDSSTTDDLEYTITMTANEHLDVSGIDGDTKSNVEVRLGNIDGPKLNPDNYTVTKTGQDLVFKFKQQVDIEGTDIYLVAQPTTLDIEGDTQPVLFSPIKLEIQLGETAPELLGSAGPSQIETNIKSSPIRLEKKVLIRV